MHYHLTTFGCQMNEHDSERIRGVLEECGWRQSGDPEEADLLVFNTCSVRESADSRLLGRLGEARRLKKERPERIVALGGCFAQNLQTRLFSDLPFLDIAFGPQNIGELPALIDAVAGGCGPAWSFDDNPLPSASLPSRRLNQGRAWVQVMTGCTNFCSYCIVPMVRGPERSRPSSQIVDEVKSLIDDGVVEITLLGQNVNAYGLDLNTASTVSENFTGLLSLLNDITDLQRIRFTTSHPGDLGDDLIAAMRHLPKVCKHLHLPAQSGSNRILTRMKRGYTREHYLELVENLYAEVPGVALTTDIIIGFPGEKEDDFHMTMKLAGKCRFDGAFTFLFSSRPGTEAADLPGRVPENTVKRRMRELLGLVQGIAAEKNEALIGSRLDIMIEGYSRHGDGLLRGRTSSNKIVNFRPLAQDGSCEPAGAVVSVEIASATSTTLIGEQVNADGQRNPH
ncbi:MAG: tRNA (N6-isopentenyl adenosine(37)-C2)-methylthiotransferase MiaB [Thermoleophilia bacterium]